MSRRDERLTGWRLAGFWIGAVGAGFALVTALAAAAGALIASLLY
jgi:hypothetical protein